MKRAISVGVIGCGYWGPLLIRNFKVLPDCRLKAVCDVNGTRLKHIRNCIRMLSASPIISAFSDDISLDAIVIATPVKYHHELAKASLLAGKHTFIEKPMASSSAECEELIEIAQKNGLVLMVDHTFLYSAPVRKIAEIVEAGDIGDIRYINSRRLNLGLFQKDINVAWDLAPHDISIILHILGEFPLTVNCQGNAHVTPGYRGCDQHVDVISAQTLRHDSEQLAGATQGPRNDDRRHSPNDRLRRSADARKNKSLRRSSGTPAALRHLR